MLLSRGRPRYRGGLGTGGSLSRGRPRYGLHLRIRDIHRGLSHLLPTVLPARVELSFIDHFYRCRHLCLPCMHRGPRFGARVGELIFGGCCACLLKERGRWHQVVEMVGDRAEHRHGTGQKPGRSVPHKPSLVEELRTECNTEWGAGLLHFGDRLIAQRQLLRANRRRIFFRCPFRKTARLEVDVVPTELP